VRLDDFQEARAMAAGFVGAGAADADGRARGDLRQELDRLAAGGVGEQLALVSVEGLLKRGGRATFFLISATSLALGARTGSQTSK
jgi:hypothetical protein